MIDYPWGNGRWKVPSSKDPDDLYLIKYWADGNHYTCDCLDGVNRNAEGCRHIKDVKEYVKKHG